MFFRCDLMESISLSWTGGKHYRYRKTREVCKVLLYIITKPAAHEVSC